MKQPEIKQCIGFGIAGNFAGHLEQAGEVTDFQQLEQSLEKPQGLFPFYLPFDYLNPLKAYPYSDRFQVLPLGEDAQLEPEIALYCEINYENDKVKTLTPLKFAAFNDCTIRKDGAKKISEKKNWGINSKGLSSTWIDIDSFDSNGILSRYSLASFVTRQGVTHAYGIDTKISNYMYFNETLVNWLVDSMNNQQDNGPLENISNIITDNRYPSHCLIAIGATAYEEFGEKHYLEVGDIVTVIAYESHITDIQQRIVNGDMPENCSLVKQTVITHI